RKEWALRQQARAVARIAEEVAQPADRALVANGFRCLGESSCPQARLARRVASAQSVFFGHFEVETQFLFHVGIAAFESAPETEAPFPQLLFHHDSSQSSACMMPAMRIHSAFSACSCRRPTAVML